MALRLALALELSALGSQRASTARLKSVKHYSITLTGTSGGTSLTNTATITAVDATKAIILRRGLNSAQTIGSNIAQEAVRLELTNGTTVTATRETGSPNAVTIYFSVVEFSTGVNSIQSGTIAIASGSQTGTATISAVSARAFVLWLGTSAPTTTLDVTEIQSGVSFSGTTVTAKVCGTVPSAYNVNWMVVDLDLSIVASVQQKNRTDDGSSGLTVFTDTITSVDPNSSIIIPNGCVLATKHGFQSNQWTHELTNSTTVTLTRVGTDTGAKEINYTVVSFNPACLDGNIQRGTISLSAQTTKTATLGTAVDSSRSFLNWGNSRCASGNANTEFSETELTNGTTVTCNIPAAASPITAYEVVQLKKAA